ncbi:MAG: hypothetical protein JWR10_2005 [Rubritepida sp.]|nr:hypothetical protein [Rubritepida sp.]
MFWASTALLAATVAGSVTTVHLHRLRPEPLDGRRGMERVLLTATLALALVSALVALPAILLLGAPLGVWGAVLLMPGTVLGFYARALAVSRGELGWALGVSLAVFLAVTLGLLAGAALGSPSTANEVLVLNGLAQGLAGGAVLMRLSAGNGPDLGRGARTRWMALLRRSLWPLAGGLAAETSSRLYVFLVAFWAGPVAMAALAAAQTLLRPATLLAGAWAAAARSALATRRHAGDQRGFRRIVLVGASAPAVATLVLGGGLALFWPFVSRWAFGGRYPDQADTVLLWTLNMAIACFVFAYGVALQALGRLRAAARADMASAVTIAISMPLLLWFLPPAGALGAMMLGGLVQVVLQRRAMRGSLAVAERKSRAG